MAVDASSPLLVRHNSFYFADRLVSDHRTFAVKPCWKCRTWIRQVSTCTSSASPPETEAQTAEACVNEGLKQFSKGRVKDALSLFETALTLNCKLFYFGEGGEGKEATDCLRIALRECNLKFGTILNDPDLASFSALPEFKDLQEEVCLRYTV